MHAGFPDVEMETQILIGKPFQCILQWIEEVDPSLLVLARHGGHRIEGTDMGSQADNLCRLSPTNVLLVGTTEVRPDDIPWIEEDGEKGLEWAPDAEVRILRVPPFALGIARKAVEEFVMEHYGPAPAASGNGAPAPVLPTVTGDRLDEAIQKLLPTHMQLIMGIGTAEELALAEVKAEDAMKRTVVEGHDADPVPEAATIETKCPYTGHLQVRERTLSDPVVWTHEAFERLTAVPLVARPLARNTVEKFAREHAVWRVTTAVMAADTFDIDTMLVMFKELQTKQIRAAAEGVDAVSPEMRKFIEEAKAQGVTRCPIRDVEEQADKCPVDLKTTTPEDAKAAVEQFMGNGGGREA